MSESWPVGDYVGSYYTDDPRMVISAAFSRPSHDGYVIVKADELRRVFRMRVCRATRVFARDEDGPMEPATAHCVEQAGHRGSHRNGYFTWAELGRTD